MFSYRSILGAVALCVSTALPSWAQDYALVLTNRDYDRVSDAADTVGFDHYAQMLRRQGFRVFGGQDWTARSMAQAAQEFNEALSSNEVARAVVILSGHMAKGPTDSWLLSREFTAVNALNVGQYGLSVNTLTALLGTQAGKSLIVLTPSQTRRPAVGGWLQNGAGSLELPQGVTGLRGATNRVLPVLRDRVLGKGDTLADLAELSGSGVTLAGFLPDAPFGGSGEQPVDGDSAYWSAVRDIDTIEAYRSYVNRFPSGLFHDEARRRIQAILERPAREAEATEQALNLSRDTRREIQRRLTLLGFDTRGIDGIFGRGTRQAIAAYQRSKGWIETGYVNRDQLATLRQDALRRARELEEEERRRRAEEERRDREYWRTTGGRGDERGLREYLRRFPDGLYSDEARDRLEELERRRRREADVNMRSAWNEARMQDTIQAYRRFMAQYPHSSFAETARDRIAELQEEDRKADLIEKHRAEEKIVAGIPVTRLLVERTLANAGFDPGKVDGTFNKKTRRAIRKFQRANDLPVSGFVSQATMVRLMARVGP